VCCGTILTWFCNQRLRITGDMGNLQVFNHAHCSLGIASHCGFDRAFLSFFNATHEGQAACGTASERRERVVVEDVAESVLFADTESQRVMLKAKASRSQHTAAQRVERATRAALNAWSQADSAVRARALCA
jgi:hypothetical protein